jgi:hypothetical protein
MLQAQQQRLSSLMSLYQAPNAFLNQYYGGGR